MLEGWYCRTLANEQAAASQNHQDDDDNDPDDSGSEDSQDAEPNHNQIDYKSQYNYLKQKLKYLLYENEFFQDALRSSQRRLLKVSRDRSFLLDRLLQYEKPENSSTESDETESSEEDLPRPETKKRKTETNGNASKNHPAKRRKVTKTKQPQQQQQSQPATASNTSNQSGPPQDGHMTAEEVERHLQSIQSINELVPERAPATVPNEMFSNEPSLDSESNDQLIETSPSNMGEDCLSVDMNAMNSQM